MEKAIKAAIIRSCHDISDGGLDALSPKVHSPATSE